MQFNDTGSATIDLTETVELYQRVKADGGVAGVADQDLGAACRRGEDGGNIAISLANKQGTQKLIANGAINKGDRVYTAEDGKVDSTQAAGSYLRGIAMADATADNDVIEVMPCIGDVAGAAAA